LVLNNKNGYDKMSTAKNTIKKFNTSDLENLLEKWDSCRIEIAKLEEKINKYKKIATKVLDDENDDILETTRYKLRRNNVTRETIGKSDIPSDIWSRYCKKVNYTSFYLTEKSSNKS
jgi:hypothetical protein